MTDSTRSVTVDGATFSVRVLGTGSPVVVPKAWLCEEYEVLAANHRLIMYDPRGRGASSPVDVESLSFEQDVEDVERIRAALALPAIAIVGWSYYGTVAARYAMHYPSRVTRLVLVGSKGIRNDLQAIRAEQTARLQATAPHLMKRLRPDVMPNPGELRALSYAMVMTRCSRRPPWPRGREKQFFEAFVQEPDKGRSYYSTNRHLAQTMGAWDWSDDARRVAAPTLVVYGRADLLAYESCVEWLRALPHGRGWLLDGVGHFPSLEDPEQFFPPLRRFLAGEWPESAWPAERLDGAAVAANGFAAQESA